MHKPFLLAALQLARLGRGRCAPNPSVGAVAVRNGEIIAQSWHRGAGTPHAEQLVIAELPEGLQDVTLYVTLEPCNHWGRTPPCVDAITQYGFAHVVYAYSDPNPVVAANDTPGLLRQQGIEVTHYPLDEIDTFYQSYRHWVATKRPFVTVKIAQSLDGKIAGEGGKRVELSNALCAEFTHQQRLTSDILLTTARTVNQDNPLLNARVEGHTTAKPVAILDNQGLLRSDAQVLQSASQCLIYHHDACAEASKATHGVTYHLPGANDHVDLTVLIQHLGELGYHDVWVEAGGELFTALHQAGIVNRTYVYIAPIYLGRDTTPGYADTQPLAFPGRVTWLTKEDNLIACFDWPETSEVVLCSQG